MARIRTIKPEFPQSETIGKLSRDARLLFVQLWTIADDSGRARAASRMLASLLYPYDDDVPRLIEGWLDELEAAECIRRYRVGTDKYLDIPNWLKHQKIDRPSPSRIPPFDEASRIIANNREPSTTDLGPSTLDLGPSTKDLGSEKGAPQAAPAPNGEASEKNRRGSRLALDSLPDDWKAWSLEARPDLDPGWVWANFHDHWIASSQRNASKLDWLAAWRNWVRKERPPPKSLFDKPAPTLDEVSKWGRS